MVSKSHKYLNAVLYQVGWFSCMLIAEPICGLIATILMIVLHLTADVDGSKEIIFIILAASLGYGMDLAISKMGYLDLTIGSSGTFYLVLLWLLFSTSLRSSMNLVFSKRKWAILLGICAPWAYWVGQNLGRVHYTEPFISSMVYHAFSWALVMYCLTILNHKLFADHEKL